MEVLTLILGVLLLLLVLYKVGTWNYGYFTSRGIKSAKTVPFFGSTACFVFRTQPIAHLLRDMCRQFKSEDMVGMFGFLTPTLVIKDPELIKLITVKEFEHFVDHRDILSEGADPIFSKNLFSLKGETWRSMRNTLSPAFTSSKLKHMFQFMDRCGEQVGEYLQRGIDQQPPGEPYVLDMKDLFTRFTNDVIATTAFGVEIDSLKNPGNEFYLTGKTVTDFGGWKAIPLLVGMLFPKVAEFLGLEFLNKKEKTFFRELVHGTITTREKLGIVRPDMIHLLMQVRKGELKAEKGEEEGNEFETNKAELTDDDIIAQVLIFFLAGFDTVSTLLSFTAMLLATNSEVQTRLQQEIDEVIRGGAEMSYDKVKSMKYLDMVIAESLRIYPPNPVQDRVCTKPITIPANGIRPAYTINKKDDILIPIYGLHHDPEYFPDPDKFDPERFSDENKHNIKPYSYLPFGVGPRLCIGQRFALLEAKIVLIHILSRFNLVVVEKTPLPLTLDCNSMVMRVKGGFWMGVVPRSKTH